MKALAIFTVAFSLLLNVQAQNYQISFSGSGQSTSVQSVEVLNLTQGTTVTVSGTDILHLLGVTDLNTDNYNTNSKLLVYPNPANENCTVGFFNTKQGVVSVQIIDITGKLIVSKSLELPQGNHTLSIEGLKLGVSIIKVKTIDQNLSARVVSMAKNDCSETIIELKESSPANYLKSYGNAEKGIVQMQYNVGERLLLKGSYETFSRVVTLLPTASQNVEFNFVACTDSHNNHYPVVTIGNQTWMAENLRIPSGWLITDNYNWEFVDNWSAYCWYDNNQAAYGSTYGALYNFYAVSNNMCPTGWHVPSKDEWTTLMDYAGGTSVAGGKLKEIGTTHWASPNSGATNEFGFSALPSGMRSWMGMFFDIGTRCVWWSSTQIDSDLSWRIELKHENASMSISGASKPCGFSVRCIKNN